MSRLIGNGLVFVGIVSIVPTYIYSTSFRKNITVKNKYIAVKDGYSRYMITDKHDNIYHVSKSLFFLKFDNAETWAKINENKMYDIRGYGFRSPLFNMYPKIIHINDPTLIDDNIGRLLEHFPLIPKKLRI